MFDKSLIAMVAGLFLLVWLPVLLVQIEERGYLLLRGWLLTAPIATNIIWHPTSNPFFAPEYLDRGIQIQEIFDPTRFLFNAFIIVVLFRWAIKGKAALTWDRTEIWMAVFSVVSLTNVLLLSKQTAAGLRIVVDAFVMPFVAYYLTRRFVANEGDFVKLIRVLGCVGVYLIIIGIIEQIMVFGSGSVHRIQGPFETRDLFYIVVMVAFFSVTLVPTLGRKYSDGLYGVARSARFFVMALAPVMVVLTWTRGNWFGFVAGGLVVAYLGRRLLSVYWKTFVLGFGAVTVALAAPLSGYFVLPERFEERVVNTSNIYERVAAWEGAVRVGMVNPVFGIGLNNLRGVLGEERTTVEGVGNLILHHNCYLGFFAELGLAGLLSYLLMVSTIMRTGLRIYRTGIERRDRWRGIGVIAVMIAYLVPAFFSTILYRPAVSHIYVYAFVGGVAGLYRLRRRVEAGGVMRTPSSGRFLPGGELAPFRSTRRF